MPAHSKLTDETQKQLADLIRAGNTVEVAADTVGIDRATFYEWLTRGERAGAANARHREFRAAVEQARVECEASLVTRIAKASANGSWGAAAWLLERRFPERWAKPDKHAGSDVTPASDAFADLDAHDELAQRRARKP